MRMRFKQQLSALIASDRVEADATGASEDALLKECGVSNPRAGGTR